MIEPENQRWFELFDELNSAVRGYTVHPKGDDGSASIRLNGALDAIRKYVVEIEEKNKEKPYNFNAMERFKDSAILHQRKLEAKLAKAVEALKRIANPDDHDIMMVIAQAALKEIGEK